MGARPVALVLLLGACTWRYDVAVQSAGAPVPEARVALECPEASVPASLGVPIVAASGPDGRVRLEATGPGLPGRCTVAVGKPGYWDRSFPIADLCSVELDEAGRCKRLSLDAELRPQH